MGLKDDVLDIKKEFQEVKNQSFAFELLQDARKTNKRQFIVIIVILAMWFASIGLFVYYINTTGYEETITETAETDDNGYAWLSNGQKEIMNNTNNGFDTLHLSNQIEGVRDGIYGISNQLCNSTADVVSAVNNGFSNAEIANNSRQIANMQQAFNSQIATLQGFNNLGSRFDDCCCENRLANKE